MRRYECEKYMPRYIYIYIFLTLGDLGNLKKTSETSGKPIFTGFRPPVRPPVDLRLPEVSHLDGHGAPPFGVGFATADELQSGQDLSVTKIHEDRPAVPRRDPTTHFDVKGTLA